MIPFITYLPSPLRGFIIPFITYLLSPLSLQVWRTHVLCTSGWLYPEARHPLKAPLRPRAAGRQLRPGLEGATAEAKGGEIENLWV